MRKHYLKILATLATGLSAMATLTMVPASAWIWLGHPRVPKSLNK